MQSTHYADPVDWEDRAIGHLMPRRQTTAWRAVIKAIYGSPLTDDEMVIYRRLSGGVDPPAGGHTRVLLVFGRRSGKTDAAGLITAFEATQRPHDLYLGPKQVGVAAVLAQDLDRADEGVNACKGYLTCEDKPGRGKNKPSRKYVVKDQVENVLLKNGLEIQKLTASEKGVRGPTVVCCIGDEIAAWDKTGPTEDERVMGALLPALAVESNGPPARRFIGITSAGYKQGFAWRIFRDHYGKADQPWLVLCGSTYDMRPSIESERAQHEAECAGRPGSFLREYLSQWGDESGEAYFPSTIVRPCVTPTCAYRTHQEGVRYYVAIDPAYRRDLFAVAVACSTREIIPGDPNGTRRRKTHLVYIDVLRAPRGSLLSATVAAQRIREVCARFDVRTVYSDQHDPEAIREALRAHGIGLVLRPWHAGHKPSDPRQKDRNPNKAERFGAVREAMISEALTLPPDEDLLRELSQIEATPLANGGVRIEGTGRNDDRAHAACLAISEALIASPSIATCTLTRWERREREQRSRRLASMLGVAGRSGW